MRKTLFIAIAITAALLPLPALALTAESVPGLCPDEWQKISRTSFSIDDLSSQGNTLGAHFSGINKKTNVAELNVYIKNWSDYLAGRAPNSWHFSGWDHEKDQFAVKLAVCMAQKRIDELQAKISSQSNQRQVSAAQTEANYHAQHSTSCNAEYEAAKPYLVAEAKKFYEQSIGQPSWVDYRTGEPKSVFLKRQIEDAESLTAQEYGEKYVHLYDDAPAQRHLKKIIKAIETRDAESYGKLVGIAYRNQSPEELHERLVMTKAEVCKYDAKHARKNRKSDKSPDFKKTVVEKAPLAVSGNLKNKGNVGNNCVQASDFQREEKYERDRINITLRNKCKTQQLVALYVDYSDQTVSVQHPFFGITSAPDKPYYDSSREQNTVTLLNGVPGVGLLYEEYKWDSDPPNGTFVIPARIIEPGQVFKSYWQGGHAKSHKGKEISYQVASCDLMKGNSGFLNTMFLAPGMKLFACPAYVPVKK